MKRIISIITIVAMLLSLTFSGTVSAKADPKVDLKQAIEIAKKTFNIDSKNYDFNSNYAETNTGQKLWTLTWNSKQPNGNGINISIDAETGEVYNMNHWEPYTGPVSKIPKYSKADALKAAEALARKLQPEKFKQTKLFESTQDKIYYSYYSDMYTFYFIRQVNGIDFQNNGITVNVDKNTLKVRYFAVEWDRAQLPDAKKAMTVEQAKKIFEEKLGLELQYYLIYQDSAKEAKPILVYTFKNGNRPIDAFSGELLNNWYGGPMYEKEALSRSNTAASAVLTPQEQKVVDDASKYISKEQALESLKKFVTVTDDYKLINASLQAGYGSENAAWYFGWDKADKEKGIYSYISGGVDAVTGEVKNFYTGENDPGYGKDETPKYTKEQCLALAEKFLQEFQPEKLKSSEYRENQYEYIGPMDKPTTYNFNYIRKVNGISAPFNSMNVTVSTRTGEVIGFSMNWSNMAFPEAQKTINLEEAYKVLYAKSDLVLKYTKLYDYRAYGDTPVTKLAYMVNDFYGMIDANTGKQIGYDGKPVVELKQQEFTDIKGHASESDIKLLIEMGVIDSTEKKFNPNSSIKQKDFIKLLVKATQPVYYPVFGSDGNEETDYYYNQAIQLRILNANEKKPEATVARQDAAKMLVKALGVGFVADLGNIYSLSFKDAKAVKPAYKGYLAIASELKMLTPVKGYINPTKAVSRGDAASMLIKLMKVDTTQGEVSGGVMPATVPMPISK